MLSKTLRIADAVSYSGLSRTAVYIAIAHGEIIARKSGKITLIDRESLDRHLESLPMADIRIPSATTA